MSNKKNKQKVKAFVKTVLNQLDEDQLRKVKRAFEKAFVEFEKEIKSDKVEKETKVEKEIKAEKVAKDFKLTKDDKSVKVGKVKKVENAEKTVKSEKVKKVKKVI
jgi:hypothetical protein